MMRTEDDLRAALASREDLAPEAPPVLAAAERAAGHRHRRVIGVTAAAAAAAAAVIAVPVVLIGESSSEPAPQPPAAGAVESAEPEPEPTGAAEPWPPLAFTIEPGVVAGFALTPFLSDPEFQSVRIRPAGEAQPVGELLVYQPDLDSYVSGPGEEVLRWEYAPGGEAQIMSYSDSELDREAAQRIADGLRFTEPYQARVPYRLDYLPAGAAPRSVTQDTAQPDVLLSSVKLASGEEDHRPLFDIEVADEGTGVDDPSWDWEPTTIAGRPAECAELVDGRRCRITLDGFTVSIGSPVLEPDELPKIIEGLHPVADWRDPATWYEVDEALPGR